ncbi:MAG: sulfurtransferase [Phycisphaeraceae bacterium]
MAVDKTYAHPDMLVSTDWVNEHRKETDKYRIVESDEDVLLYATGHLPEAVKIDWVNDLNDPVVRDYVEGEKFAALCSKHGIGNDTTVIFYGDKNNWWACYALWVFMLNGHTKCLIMDGGRKKWIDESKPLTKEVAKYASKPFKAGAKNPAIRALRDQTLAHMKANKAMIDVRSPQEFSGERTHMAEYPQEGVLRGGHIPGAKNVPWAKAVAETGEFKPRAELEKLYLGEAGLKPGEEVVAYCRIGERSSHTWFVLKYLLGFENVKNYDGSWTEWGNSVGLPIEKTYQPA